jgi:CheY-like chemotaxis protein
MIENEILLVDDDQFTNFLNEIIIKKVTPKSRIKVFEASQAALDYIIQNHQQIALLFLDINMPILDGWEICKVLMEKGFNIPVAILSSSDDQKDLSKAASFPFIKKYLLKPLEPDEVSSFIKSI